MLKKKLGKKALAFASAAVMAVSATATGLTALSMTAFAGEELGEGTFENGKGLPWHIWHPVGHSLACLQVGKHQIGAKLL